MDDAHVMVNEASNERESLYECPVEGCGRRLIVDWRRPALTVLDQGDVWARHVGATGGLQLAVAAP